MSNPIVVTASGRHLTPEGAVVYINALEDAVRRHFEQTSHEGRRLMRWEPVLADIVDNTTMTGYAMRDEERRPQSQLR